MSSYRRCFAGLLALSFAGACAGSGTSFHTDSLAGTWKTPDGSRLMRFEPDRLVVSEDGYLKALAILSRAPGTLVVRNGGLKEVWSIARQGDELRVVRGAESLTYEPLKTRLVELDFSPLPLGTIGVLATEDIQTIQRELVERRDLDQAVRKDPKRRAEMREVDADNVRYLKALVQRVGWIDSERFGKPASAAAVLMAKHSSDPRLMQAILPAVEADVKRGALSAELFSVLYDELQLTLGRKQRYGTQLQEDAAGPFVLPLEDAGRVDAIRAEIGLPPLTEYLQLASKYLYEGKEIRLRSDEE